MSDIIFIIELVNTLSPLGLSALLAIIIWMLVKGRKDVTAQVANIGSNHLHEVNDSLQRIEALLRSMNDHVVWIRAKVNGG